MWTTRTTKKNHVSQTTQSEEPWKPQELNQYKHLNHTSRVNTKEPCEW